MFHNRQKLNCIMLKIKSSQKALFASLEGIIIKFKICVILLVVLLSIRNVYLKKNILKNKRRLWVGLCLWYGTGPDRTKKHFWEFTIPVQETDTGSLLIKFAEIFFIPVSDLDRLLITFSDILRSPVQEGDRLFTQFSEISWSSVQETDPYSR